MTEPFRVAVCRDFRAEGWPSMDLCADMLLATWPDGRGADVCPAFRRRAGRIPVLGRCAVAVNADRLWNRFVTYPAHLRRTVSDFAAFHLVDHSYAHLVHSLPPARVGVFCHDLDTFRCVLEPEKDRRPRWFRAMARRILRGLNRAAVVFHATAAVRADIIRFGLVDPAKLVYAPYGVSPEFVPDPPPDSPPVPWLDAAGGQFLLHVGSCIPRKRIDVLLEVFARVRVKRPDVRLVKVGGMWTAEQTHMIARLGLGDGIVHATDRPRAELAAAYRRAAVTLVPSEAEGFGLPVVEALACGSTVVASDLPALREVGGSAVTYRPVADVPAWAAAVLKILTNSATAPPRMARLARASEYRWTAHADAIAGAYRRLLAGSAAAAAA